MQVFDSKWHIATSIDQCITQPSSEKLALAVDDN